MFDYPLSLFIIFVGSLLLFSIESIYFGYIFYFVSEKHGIERLKILFLGFLAIGISSILYLLGWIYFALYGTAETPIDLSICIINFLPLTVGLFIASTFLWYMSFFTYARLQRNDKIRKIDALILGIGCIGIIVSLLPQNMWMRSDIPRLQEPTPWNPNPPIYLESIIRLSTALLIIFIGFMTIFAYYLLYKKKRRENPDDIITLRRHGYLLIGILLMVIANLAMAMRDIAAIRGEEILPPEMVSLIIIAFLQAMSAFALYVGIIAPEWMTRRWAKR